MDFGISALTDDQWLELMKQACADGVQRHPAVREMAQQAIYDANEQMRVAKESLEEALEEARSEYRQFLKAEALEFVRAGINDGSLRLQPDQEEVMVVQSTLEAHIALIDETVKMLQKGGSTGRFFCEIDHATLTMSYGSTRVKSAHNLTPDQIRNFGAQVKKVLGA